MGLFVKASGEYAKIMATGAMTLDEALMTAVNKGNLEMLQDLCQRFESEVDIQEFQAGPECNEWTLLHVACLRDHTAVVRYLVQEQHVHLHALDSGGRTPLHIGCQKGHLDTVQYLVQEILLSQQESLLHATDNF